MSNRRFSSNNSGRKNHQRRAKNSDQQRNQIRNIPNLMNKSFIDDESYDEISEQYRVPSTKRHVKLHRTSSPNSIMFCEHCAHDHLQECCLYIYDDLSDIARYASFKKELDEPYWVTSHSEDFDLAIGKVTPKHFPCKFLNISKWFSILKLSFLLLGFTDNDPEKADRELLASLRPPPVIYLRQYVWPVLLPPIHRLPFENINMHTNPLNIKFTLPPCYGNFFKQHQLPQPYIPCIMRQLAIPVDVRNHQMTFDSSQPQIVESHSYLPIHYC